MKMSHHHHHNRKPDDDDNYPFKRPFAPVKYKKAPNAPRRFKSSYMFFSTYKHKQIREELAKEGKNSKVCCRVVAGFFFVLITPADANLTPTAPSQMSTTEVAKMVSKAWKDLPEEEREKWEEKGRKDKARYEMEKAMYSGPWKVPVTGRRSKDPTRPKRPMSAFLSYSNRMRSEVKEKNKNAKTAEISRILAEMWKNEDPEVKKEFVDEEFKLRTDYKKAMAEWKEKTEKEFNDQREARENEAMKLVLEGKLPPDPFPTTNATSLPNGAEYSSRAAEDTFASGADLQRQQYPNYAAAPGAAARGGGEGSTSATAAAFQPPLDAARRADASAYGQMYGAYMHPGLYGYPALYPGKQL